MAVPKSNILDAWAWMICETVDLGGVAKSPRPTRGRSRWSGSAFILKQQVCELICEREIGWSARDR